MKLYVNFYSKVLYFYSWFEYFYGSVVIILYVVVLMNIEYFFIVFCRYVFYVYYCLFVYVKDLLD